MLQYEVLIFQIKFVSCIDLSHGPNGRISEVVKGRIRKAMNVQTEEFTKLSKRRMSNKENSEMSYTAAFRLHCVQACSFQYNMLTFIASTWHCQRESTTSSAIYMHGQRNEKARLLALQFIPLSFYVLWQNLISFLLLALQLRVCTIHQCWC